MANWVDGEKIMALRAQQGLSLRELAKKAQIDHSILSRLERNLQPDCMLSVIVSIASALGVTVDELLPNGEQAKMRRLIPELQAVSNELAERPANIQRLAASTLRGLLSALDND